MIKLKDLLIEATIACGECLSYVWKVGIMNQDNKQANRKMKIVYGTVQSKWISKGKRYRHAWVEDGNLVKEWQKWQSKWKIDFLVLEWSVMGSRKLHRRSERWSMDFVV